MIRRLTLLLPIVFHFISVSSGTYSNLCFLTARIVNNIPENSNLLFSYQSGKWKVPRAFNFNIFFCNEIIN